MEVSLIVTVSILGGLVLVGLIVYAAYKAEKARTERFQAIAAELGLEFYPKGDTAIRAALDGLRLFKQGHSKKTKNMICGQTGGVEVAIFGYRYTTGGGKNSQTHQQTVISLRSPDLALPEFELRPENVFHKIGKAFGYGDINIESHPEFSKRYLLRSPDEDGVRARLTPEVLDFFESHEGVSVEAANDVLIYYRAGKRIKPEDVRSFMEEGSRVYKLFNRG